MVIYMERSTMLLIGKPSISMGHLYHGYVSHNQMVTDFIHQFLTGAFAQGCWMGCWMGCWGLLGVAGMMSLIVSQWIIPKNSLRKTHQTDYGEFWEWKMMDTLELWRWEPPWKLLGNFSARGRSWGNFVGMEQLMWIIAIVPNITMDGPHQVSIETTITSI